jgi:non-ribosomal peptide synthetase component F
MFHVDMHPPALHEEAGDFARDGLTVWQEGERPVTFFTSGSTGVPKGVVIPHRRVINYISWARDIFSIGSEEVIGSQAPFYFTVSAMDIYLCLATGSKLCIIPENLFSRPKKLLLFLNEHKISLIFWVSSVYHHIANMDALREISIAHLKRAWFVGEPMPLSCLTYWIEYLPGVEFTNLYGSTETDLTIFYRVPGNTPISSIPLGYPCANTAVLLLTDDLTVAKIGEIGELCIRGSCLASGYYKDPDKTRSVFIQNPLHSDYTDILYRTGDLGEIIEGLIYFHGRRDHQFKHLGFRVEAGEIEAIAAKYNDIKSTCVLYDSDNRQIVLFYEAITQIDELAYRHALMENLPVYMIPTRFIWLTAMPYNANQKKDRMFLKSQYITNGVHNDK